MSPSGSGRGAAVWALAGVAALFGSAVLRLGGRGVETMLGGLAPLQWAVLAALTVFMVYTEGVLTFQRRWVPKLIERARVVRRERLWLKLLAPLYGMALVGGPPARNLRAWLGTMAIVGAIIAVRALPDPWRGVVDFAVAAALGWGLVCIARRARDALEG